jgi:orotate phosphoribosyltransferase
MKNTDTEVTQIFEETQALLKGHFILRSGLRSEFFFQCAQVCQHLEKVSRLAQLMIEKLTSKEIDLVIAPAMGGLVIGQEVARQLGARFIFLEKVDDKLALRRNFRILPQDKVLLVEDVVTRGGRVLEAIGIINEFPCNFSGVVSLVDRSTEPLNFGVPFTSLIKMNFPTYNADDLPEHLQSLPAVKPGS